MTQSSVDLATRSPTTRIAARINVVTSRRPWVAVCDCTNFRYVVNIDQSSTKFESPVVVRSSLSKISAGNVPTAAAAVVSLKHALTRPFSAPAATESQGSKGGGKGAAGKGGKGAKGGKGGGRGGKGRGDGYKVPRWRGLPTAMRREVATARADGRVDPCRVRGRGSHTPPASPKRIKSDFQPKPTSK